MNYTDILFFLVCVCVCVQIFEFRHFSSVPKFIPPPLKVLLDRAAIEKERADSATENQRLRGMLKQYLDGDYAFLISYLRGKYFQILNFFVVVVVVTDLI